MVENPPPHLNLGCGAACTVPLDFHFTMAFQPIVDLETGDVFAHEALVRGLNGEGAGVVLGQVRQEQRYTFDQGCRVKALELASRLGMDSRLSINFLPNAVYDPAHCLRSTLEAAQRFGFPPDRIIFEVTEGERIADPAHLKRIFAEYKRRGFTTAIDDFGAGYAGLNLLAEFQPDILKLDMDLVRGIDGDRVRRSIITAILGVCRDLDMQVIAEGIETEDELRTLWSMGVRYVQGYLLARPAFEAVTPPDRIRLPELAPA